MNEHLPGVHVPDGLLHALEEAGPEAEALGTAQCVEIVSGLRAMQGVSGVHVMGLGREEAVRHVIEGAGLLPRPSVPSA
jgi:methylenetetrahydrofolate reductase (NADPH)